MYAENVGRPANSTGAHARTNATTGNANAQPYRDRPATASRRRGHPSATPPAPTPASRYGVADATPGMYVDSCATAISAPSPTTAISAPGTTPPAARSTANPAPTHNAPSTSGYTRAERRNIDLSPAESAAQRPLGTGHQPADRAEPSAESTAADRSGCASVAAVGAREPRRVSARRGRVSLRGGSPSCERSWRAVVALCALRRTSCRPKRRARRRACTSRPPTRIAQPRCGAGPISIRAPRPRSAAGSSFPARQSPSSARRRTTYSSSSARIATSIGGSS